MKVVLNGRPRELCERALVRDAVRASGADETGRGIAVAIDGEVVPRPQWGALELRDGQRVEVVRAVQGG